MSELLAPLIADGVVEEVISRLKTGKEAELFIVVHAGEIVAAKVYKERHARNFRNNAAYKEGRSSRSSRTQRAMDKGSRFGQRAAEEAWKAQEYEALTKLHADGLRVPQPILMYEGVLLMELVIDPDGQPAPRLIDAGITPELAAGYYADLRQQVIRMLLRDLIHGDLSPFNVLLAWNGPTIIDFPQVIGAAHNSQAERFFTRDLENIHRFFATLDPALAPHESDAREIWHAYTRRELTPDFVPSGNWNAPAGRPGPRHEGQRGGPRGAPGRGGPHASHGQGARGQPQPRSTQPQPAERGHHGGHDRAGATHGGQARGGQANGGRAQAGQPQSGGPRTDSGRAHPQHAHADARQTHPREARQAHAPSRDVNAGPAQRHDAHAGHSQSRDAQTRPAQPRDTQMRHGQSPDAQVRQGQPRDAQARHGQSPDAQVRQGQPRDAQARHGQPRDAQVRHGQSPEAHAQPREHAGHARAGHHAGRDTHAAARGEPGQGRAGHPHAPRGDSGHPGGGPSSHGGANGNRQDPRGQGEHRGQPRRHEASAPNARGGAPNANTPRSDRRHNGRPARGPSGPQVSYVNRPAPGTGERRDNPPSAPGQTKRD